MSCHPSGISTHLRFISNNLSISFHWSWSNIRCWVRINKLSKLITIFFLSSKRNWHALSCLDWECHASSVIDDDLLKSVKRNGHYCWCIWCGPWDNFRQIFSGWSREFKLNLTCFSGIVCVDVDWWVNILHFEINNVIFCDTLGV